MQKRYFEKIYIKRERNQINYKSFAWCFVIACLWHKLTSLNIERIEFHDWLWFLFLRILKFFLIALECSSHSLICYFHKWFSFSHFSSFCYHYLLLWWIFLASGVDWLPYKDKTKQCQTRKMNSFIFRQTDLIYLLMQCIFFNYFSDEIFMDFVFVRKENLAKSFFSGFRIYVPLDFAQSF